MLTQRNLAFIAEKIAGARAGRRRGPADQLPAALAHRRAGRLAPAVARDRRDVYFAESLEKLPENLREVRPQFFLGVPRVWEKIQAGIQAAGAQASPLRRRIAAWARGVGRAAATPTRQGGRGPGATRSRTSSSSRRCARGSGSTRPACSCVSAGPDRQGDARLLPEPRHADHGGLRHERVHRARPRCRCPSATASGAPATRIPGTELADRRGRRDPDARAARLPGLLQERGGDARGARRRRLAPLGRRGRDRRRRLPAHHRPQEGAAHHRRRQEHRARSTSRASSSRSPRCRRRSRSATAGRTWWRC